MLKIELFVQLKTTEPIKLINHETKIYETYTPNKIESKLIQRLIKKSEYRKCSIYSQYL